MATYTKKMVLEWAKVFGHNMDKGDPNGSRAAQGVAKKGGQYVVNAYPTSQEDLDELINDGMQLNPMNGKRVKDGNQEYGIGSYITLKRDAQDNIKVFNNKGKEVTVNYGGPVEVLDFRDYYADPEGERDLSKVKPWDAEEMGEIGNGSVAFVQFDVYSDGAGVRLNKIGVVELVEYVREKSDAEAAFG